MIQREKLSTVNALLIYTKTISLRKLAEKAITSGIIEEVDITMDKLNITTCPSCGGKRIKGVRRDATRTFKRKEYTVPDLEYYECPDCGEKVYDREAMRRIEAHSPAFKRAASKRKPAKPARTAASLKS